MRGARCVRRMRHHSHPHSASFSRISPVEMLTRMRSEERILAKALPAGITYIALVSAGSLHLSNQLGRIL